MVAGETRRLANESPRNDLFMSQWAWTGVNNLNKKKRSLQDALVAGKMGEIKVQER